MEHIAQIAAMIRSAEQHCEDQSKERLRAIEYYQGEMKDTPADDGRSSVTTRDVRAHVKKVLPSLVRTILGADEVVEYLPQGEGDEEGAQQASDYVNHVIGPECDLARHIEDALHDAALQRNGILRWWWETRRDVRISTHTGLTDDALAELLSDEGTELIEQSERAEVVEVDGQPVAVPFYDVTVRRYQDTRRIRVSCVPRERFLIHPDAVSLEESPVVGEMSRVTRSDLVAMGHDKDMVMGIALADDLDDERDARRDVSEDRDEPHRPNEQVEYYDVFVRVDMDGDGIAELHRMCFAGGLAEKNLLMDEPADEVQFADVKVMTQPHQWEGISLADDLMDIQRVKTVLLRQTLDNIYWQNNPQPVMQDGAVIDPDAVFNPEFGKPIRIRQGFPVREAYGFQAVPFVGNSSFAMMEYLDTEAQDRTGVSDASAGLAPDALQNMTAKASAMIEQAGIGQTELMVRTAAGGLRRFFRGLLRMVVRHQDVPRTVRLRGEWVQIDPRQWNAEMDASVNVGLGAGTRERDMQVMQMVLNLQREIYQNFGPQNPFVDAERFHNTISRMVEAAGLKSSRLYFKEPDPDEVAALMQAAAQQKDPALQKAEAQMQFEQARFEAQAQIDQAKTAAQIQLEQVKAQAAVQKEQAQMEADLEVKRAEIEATRRAQADKLQAETMLARERMAWEREKFEREQALERDRMAMAGFGQPARVA